MSAVVRRPQPRVTVSDFLTWPGDGTAKRYQLVDGEIRAMSPAGTTHGRIQARLAYLIERRLEETGSTCRLLTEAAIIPGVGAETNLRVPDLAVTCRAGEPREMVLPDPILLVEILSPGNESDTRANIRAYMTIPSVREILVVRSTRIAAEVLRRRAGGLWPDGPEMLDADAVLRLDTVDLSCGLHEFYARTHLERAIPP